MIKTPTRRSGSRRDLLAEVCALRRVLGRGVDVGQTVPARGDGRGRRTDHDRYLLALLQDDGRNRLGVARAVYVGIELRVRAAVTADAVVRQPHAPLREQ